MNDNDSTSENDNISENDIRIINTYTNLDNLIYTVEWFVDTTPDYSLSNNYIDTNQIVYLTQTNMNNNVRIYTEDELMPSNPKKIKWISIDVEVCGIVVSEEDRNCCICYEIKEYQDISQINCGHKFCGTCIIDHISINYINPCCPLCREKIVYITFQRDFYEADFKNL
jgi:hypothetical protein